MNKPKDKTLIERVRNYLKEHDIRRISNYEVYEVVKDFECPYCHKSGVDPWLILKEPTLVGWTETPNGFMMCFECPECFSKFRWHGSTTERNDEDEFLLYAVYPKACLQCDTKLRKDS